VGCEEKLDWTGLDWILDTVFLLCCPRIVLLLLLLLLLPYASRIGACALARALSLFSQPDSQVIFFCVGEACSAVCRRCLRGEVCWLKLLLVSMCSRMSVVYVVVVAAKGSALDGMFVFSQSRPCFSCGAVEAGGDLDRFFFPSLVLWCMSCTGGRSQRCFCYVHGLNLNGN